MDELDIRGLSVEQGRQQLNQWFTALPRNGMLVAVASGDPAALRAQFDLDHADSFGWAAVQETGEVWRIEIIRLTTSDLPRILCNTNTVAAEAATNGTAGAVWKLQPSQRHLDANIIHLPAHDTINSHLGPDLDVLVLVVSGEGNLTTETGDVRLTAGCLVWLPQRSFRAITADRAGLTYFTVHQRRSGLAIGRRPPDEPRPN